MLHVKRIEEIKNTVEPHTYPTQVNLLFNVLDLLLGKEMYVCITGKNGVGKEFGIRFLEMSLDGHDGKMVCVDRIEMETQGIGSGSALMELVCKWADQNGVTLTLTPSVSFGASSVTRLVEFYKRFGFVYNKGRYTIFGTRQAMYRLPK